MAEDKLSQIAKKYINEYNNFEINNLDFCKLDIKADSIKPMLYKNYIEFKKNIEKLKDLNSKITTNIKVIDESGFLSKGEITAIVVNDDNSYIEQYTDNFCDRFINQQLFLHC